MWESIGRVAQAIEPDVLQSRRFYICICVGILSNLNCCSDRSAQQMLI